MEYKDYYKILGVEKNATEDQIKKQYRLMARKYHPDVSKEKDAEEKFKEVQEAYEVLKDPKKRSAYDQMGSNWKQGQGFTPPPEWEFQQGGGAGSGFEDIFGREAGFSDFFESLFGQQRSRGGGSKTYRGHARRGQDQLSQIHLSLEEAYSGTERTIQFQEPERDPATGAVQTKSRSIRAKIPAGVIQGQQIRLTGQGGKGTQPNLNGDLYLEVFIAEHPFYKVEGKNIFLNLPVTPWEAALGAKIAVPTLGGKVELSVPPGSQTGTKLRLKGRGLPGTPKGDQFVRLGIYTPEAKTDPAKELYRKMAEIMPFDPRTTFHT